MRNGLLAISLVLHQQGVRRQTLALLAALALTAEGIALDFSAVQQRRSAANESVFEIERAA